MPQDTLITIQSRLKAPKNQYNSFGKYSYRNCEDILEAVKPLLAETKAHLIIYDDIHNIGDRYYVRAIVELWQEKELVAKSQAFAREAETKKGMDESQITGAASSYARKYALNGLFAIDDTKDADSNGKEKTELKKEPKPEKENQSSKASPDRKMTDPQKKKLWAMMMGKGLSKDEAKSFFDFINPKSLKEASEFIKEFDEYHTVWLDDMGKPDEPEEDDNYNPKASQEYEPPMPDEENILF